jgi:predicted branched-subunit amino acid permease
MLFRLRRLSADPHFRRGVADTWAMAPGICAWGLVTGVAMVQSGLGIWLSLLMSFTVYAGTAQLTALPLIAAGAPLWVVCASALCVNVRFIIFSAQWRTVLDHLPRWQRMSLCYPLADVNLAVFQKAWGADPLPQPGQAAYIAGGATIWLGWQGASVTGILSAAFVPLHWGLGFAGTLSMLGLTYALIVGRATAAAALVAATAAVATVALPLKMNILVAIAAAAAAGALVAGRQAGTAAILGGSSAGAPIDPVGRGSREIGDTPR